MLSATNSGLRGYVVLGRSGWGPLLGALTPDQAAEMIFPLARVTSSAGHNKALRDQMVASAGAGQVVNAQGAPDYIPGTSQCSASGVSKNIQLGQIGGQLALTGVNIGALSSPAFAAALGGTAILGAATLGIGAIIGLLPIFLGHHAAAVKKEQNVLCSLIPAVNNYLLVIDQAVRTGKATPQQGIDALNSLVNDFQPQVASIIHGSDPMSAGECNAACAELSKLRAIVARMQSQYQDLIAATPPVPASSGPSMAPPVSSGGGVLTLPVAPTPAQIAAASGAPGFQPSIVGTPVVPGTVPAAPAASAPGTPGTTNYLPIMALIVVALLLTKGF